MASLTSSRETSWFVRRAAGGSALAVPQSKPPTPTARPPPQNYYIARIEGLWSDKDRDMMEVTWFYAPEDTAGGRKKRDGKRFEPASGPGAGPP